MYPQFKNAVGTLSENDMTMYLKVYGYTTMFSAIFAKGDNYGDFLFASEGNETLPGRGLP